LKNKLLLLFNLIHRYFKSVRNCSQAAGESWQLGGKWIFPELSIFAGCSARLVLRVSDGLAGNSNSACLEGSMYNSQSLVQSLPVPMTPVCTLQIFFLPWQRAIPLSFDSCGSRCCSACSCRPGRLLFWAIAVLFHCRDHRYRDSRAKGRR